MSFGLKAGLTNLALNLVAKPEDKKKKDVPTDSGFNEKNKDLKEVGSDAPKKAAAPKAPKKQDDTLHCPSCGSGGPWTISSMTLTIMDVPASKLSKTGEGNTYDDTKGDSQGWDYTQDGQVKCNKCGNEADVNELMTQAGGAAPEMVQE